MDTPGNLVDSRLTDAGSRFSNTNINRKGLKGSVRDLGQSDLCKNIGKTGSLPCPLRYPVTVTPCVSSGPNFRAQQNQVAPSNEQLSYYIMPCSRYSPCIKRGPDRISAAALAI